MLRRRTEDSLAPAVAAALIRTDTDASQAEVAEVRKSVGHSLTAMPDTLAFGVRAVSLLADAALLVLGHGDFRKQREEAQGALAVRLARLPLPGMAEFVRLTRGLGMVSLYESRATRAEPGFDPIAGRVG